MCVCVCVCVCILALVTQHAKRMCRIILSSVACLAVPHFSHHVTNGMAFEKKNSLTHNMPFDFLYNFCLKSLSFKEEISEIFS
jgi:hypothetical protein